MSEESIVYARRLWTWELVTRNRDYFGKPFERRFDEEMKRVNVDVGVGDQFQKLLCAQITRSVKYSPCTANGEQCPNTEYYKKLTNRERRHKSRLKSISVSNEKGFLDPETALKTRKEKSFRTFRCGQEEKEKALLS